MSDNVSLSSFEASHLRLLKFDHSYTKLSSSSEGACSAGCQMPDMPTLQQECGSTSNAAKLEPQPCL